MSKIPHYENLSSVAGRWQAHRLIEPIYGLLEWIKEVGTWKVRDRERAK